jgi:hypothetical protein
LATNNALNLKSSGIASYDGAGTFSALANPLTVANGGTGDSSLTAYAVLCGGTTTTNPVQSIASVGSSTQILTSNGAGALPTFQYSSLGGYFIYLQTTTGNPADGFSVIMGQDTAITTNGSTNYTRYYIPRTGTIVAAYGGITVQGTLGSANNTTVSIKLNGTTTTNISTTVATSATSNAFNNTALSIAVTAGDYIEFTVLGPTWTTNPTTVALSVTALVI